MIPQPPSIGPDEWKISPFGGVRSALIWSCPLSNCAWLIPGSLIRMPTAMLPSFSREDRPYPANLLAATRRPERPADGAQMASSLKSRGLRAETLACADAALGDPLLVEMAKRADSYDERGDIPLVLNLTDGSRISGIL